MTGLVTVDRHGGVGVLTLNAPRHRNILSAEMVADIGRAMDDLEADPDVRCLVVTGAGSAFCAGAELATLSAAADGDFGPVEQVYQGFLRVLRSPLPSIAAVHGPAVGAGFNLALACDVRLAGPGAVFDTRFAELRIHPGGGHAWLLARAVGRQQATVACLFGEVWDSAAALRVGLVAGVVQDPVADALALGHRLDRQEPAYVRTLTATMRDALTTPEHAVALDAETAAQRWSTTRSAFREGVRAIEHRIGRKS
jgi:enoyl-CoA hydratase